MEFSYTYSKNSKKNHLIIFVIMFCILIMSINCGGRPIMDLQSKSAQPVILGPGDAIEIKFSYTPELNEIQTVRPDGKIMLQLIGEVEVLGKSPDELKNELVKQYETELKKPDITVIVHSFYSRRIYVSGEVISPGFIEMPGRMTALEAIVQSGGFNSETAAVKNVIIIREKEGRRFGYKLDLKPAIQGKDNQPFFLEPYDVVYVPKNKIATLGTWVDQYINNVLPRVLVSSFGYYLLQEFVFKE